MKKIIIALGLLLLSALGGLYWILKWESGGSDDPLEKNTAENICQRWVSPYADSIFCKWWTGGTQEWAIQVRFHYPENRESATFDTLLSENLSAWRRRIKIQKDKRFDLAEKFGPNKHWWMKKNDSNLIHLGPNSQDKYGDYVWIDTVLNTVFWISR